MTHIHTHTHTHQLPHQQKGRDMIFLTQNRCVPPCVAEIVLCVARVAGELWAADPDRLLLPDPLGQPGGALSPKLHVGSTVWTDRHKSYGWLDSDLDFTHEVTLSLNSWIWGVWHWNGVGGEKSSPREMGRGRQAVGLSLSQWEWWCSPEQRPWSTARSSSLGSTCPWVLHFAHKSSALSIKKVGTSAESGQSAHFYGIRNFVRDSVASQRWFFTWRIWMAVELLSARGIDLWWKVGGAHQH